MNQSSVKPVSAVQPSDGNALSKLLTSVQAETAIQNRSKNARQEKLESEAKNESGESVSLANVSIHFRVDEKTNKITVFLVDRQTKKVLRSIPASELQKLQIGDLLKITG
jgi:uncharacterized FlaG/YvyC family protein